MLPLTDHQRALALTLFDIGCVDLQSKLLKKDEGNPDAVPSPIFFNLRTPENPKPGPLTPGVIERIANELRVHLRQTERAYYIAGIPNAGRPFAQALAKDVPGGQLLLEKEVHGDKRRITQLRTQPERVQEHVVLIDDLVTGADTKFEAIQAIQAGNLSVRDIIVLIDREQGGRKNLEEAGFRVRSVFTIFELIDLYVDTGRMTEFKRAEIRRYIASNQV